MTTAFCTERSDATSAFSHSSFSGACFFSFSGAGLNVLLSVLLSALETPADVVGLVDLDSAPILGLLGALDLFSFSSSGFSFPLLVLLPPLGISASLKQSGFTVT